MKTVLLTVGLIGIAIVLLGIKALFVKGGKFPSGHAHQVMKEYERRHARQTDQKE